jgi:hypothetical protein
MKEGFTEDARLRPHESTPRGGSMMTVNSRSNVSRQDCLWEADDETPRTHAPTAARVSLRRAV